VVISIASLVLGREGVKAEVATAIKGLLGDKGAEAVNTMLTSAGKPSEGIFASIIGTAALIFAAIGVVVQLKEALNTVWEVRKPPGKGLWGFVRAYVLSLAGVLAIGFLLLVSMLLTAGLAAVSKNMGNVVPEAFAQAASFALSFAVISVLFAMMFKWLPDAPVAWRDVWLSAVVTAALYGPRSNASATRSAPATSLSTKSGNYAGFGYGWRKSTSPSFRDSPPGAGGPPDDFGYALAAE
jgi:membrane protein